MNHQLLFDGVLEQLEETYPLGESHSMHPCGHDPPYSYAANQNNDQAE
jgi:hypothetical protein